MSTQKIIFRATVIRVEEQNVTVNYNETKEKTVQTDGQPFKEFINIPSAVYLIEYHNNNVIEYSIHPRHSGRVIRRISVDSTIVEFNDHGNTSRKGINCTDHQEGASIWFTGSTCDCVLLRNHGNNRLS